MSGVTYQSQCPLLISYFLLVTVFHQNYCALVQPSSSSKRGLVSSALENRDLIKENNSSEVKVESLVEEFEDVVEKISRDKRFYTAQPNVEQCSPEKLVERNNCMKDLLPQVNFGIPSNRHETETACRSFFMAMKCMGTWASLCLNETSINSYNAYVAPAAETYSYICKDKQSRAKFYRHGECFRKITPGFDACVDEMGSKLNALQENKHAMQICCHQRSFLNCVSQVLIRNQCSVASSQATMETAERTVQFRPDQILRKNNTKGVCVRMTNDQCVDFLDIENRKPKIALATRNDMSLTGILFVCLLIQMFA